MDEHSRSIKTAIIFFTDRIISMLGNKVVSGIV